MVFSAKQHLGYFLAPPTMHLGYRISGGGSQEGRAWLPKKKSCGARFDCDIPCHHGLPGHPGGDDSSLFEPPAGLVQFPTEAAEGEYFQPPQPTSFRQNDSFEAGECTTQFLVPKYCSAGGLGFRSFSGEHDVLCIAQSRVVVVKNFSVVYGFS